ncbi:hypothetical protein [Anditalea andensis]|nr:hypothetical protein [Anditalea andensis]
MTGIAQLRLILNIRGLYEEVALPDAEPLIELRYAQNFFRFMSYYQDGTRLSNRELTSLLGNQGKFQDLLKKANIQRGIGTGLTIAGGLGLIGGAVLLFDEGHNGVILAGPSLVSLISGGILLNASRANRQSAVNLYNKQLFQSATGTASLDLKVNPANSGLVLSF